MGYTVGEVARWSGITVRTLHHYEHIALLAPAGRSSSGYRVYDDADLERLQQILFYRELGFSLDHIAAALATPTDAVDHLACQRELLLDRIQRLQGLVAAIDQAMEAKTMGTTPTPAERFAALNEGKTKVILDAGDGTVLIRSKDDITAGDGGQHDVLDGKAAASTRTTSNIFRLLERNGVPTHFVDRVDDVTFRARNVRMIPLELIARRYATGSVRDRLPQLPDGTVFEELVFEMFEKDDANHDPLLQFDFDAGVLRRFVPNTKAAEAIGPEVKAGDLVSEEAIVESRYADVSPDLVERLRALTVAAFEVIESAWRDHGGVYIDFKIECGFDRETGELLVADVIDSDSGRLRFGEVDMSKQSYRDGTATLPEIKKKFDEVASVTDSFV